MVAGNAENAAELMRLQKSLVRKKSRKTEQSIRSKAGKNDLQVLVVAGGALTTKRLRAGAKTDSKFDNEYDYALAEEFGTAPHIVGGKFAGARHPGSRPVPFFFPPFRALKKSMKRKMGQKTKAAAQAVARGG